MHREPTSCWWLCAAFCSGCLAPLVAAPSSRPAGGEFDGVRERARQLATQPHRAPKAALPESLQALDYDTYRLIGFRRDHTYWRGEAQPFRLQFFHRGYLHQARVAISVLQHGATHEIDFSSDMFEYHGQVRPETLPPHLGFAGFRVLYPLNRPDKADELISFLGASYFRALGTGQFYGVSARGLAIDMAPGRTEEFPAFTAFWIEHPAPDAHAITVYALLDSPSLAGAYRFTIQPGERTIVDVKADLFAREDIALLGLAPLTSMFLFDRDSSPARRRDDFRPAVHDSDALLWIDDLGRPVFRPLQNPSRPHISHAAQSATRGFGLLQRERRFEHYLDREAHYDRRPSVWVEPRGDWGSGSVELVELPSDREGYDNVTAYWKPAQPLTRGDTRRYRYRLYFCTTPPRPHDLGQVRGTQWKWRADGAADFRIEFAGGPLAQLNAGAEVECAATAVHGRIRGATATRVPESPLWQATFTVEPEGAAPVELAVGLNHSGRPVTELWSYLWNNSR